MSKIKDILSIQLENDIKNVIDLNSQKENDIKSELEDFILTESLAKHLSNFLDAFCSDMKESGVWISGFYGSGKSYFAKMLGYLIANPIIIGTSMRERFMPKLTGLKNEALIKNQVASLGKFDYQVVMFNVDKVDTGQGLPLTAMRRFLLSLGLMDNWIGFMQYEMLLEGRLEDFNAVIQEQNEGKTWREALRGMASVAKFKQAALKLYNISADDYEEKKKLIEQKIQTYDAEALKQDMESYLALYPKMKIVFFIDEVSEALMQGKIKFLDLQGVSESLSSLGDKVWTVCIAQQVFQHVLNATGASLQQLNKVEARFKTRIAIAAEEIDTIIRRRLLTKTEEGEQQLQTYYSKNDGTVLEVTNIAGIALQPTKDAQTYSDYYPFFEHQFKMLQYFFFGSRETVTSQIGTRGILIAVFDVLKKEALTEADVYTHVNATQLCNQADDHVTETLRLRYQKADDLLSNEPFKYIKGKQLLQTIHFLDKSDANTTSENIARSYVRRLEHYYDILSEVKQALEILTEHNILIKASNQYKITSQIEQQIIDDMNAFEVPLYRATAEVTKTLKQLRMVKICQSVQQDGLAVPFCVETAIGENIANQGEKFMKVVLYDLFYQEDYNGKVASVKQETQSEKGKASIVPNNTDATTILNLAKDLLRMDYIEGKSYSTAEEKKVVNTIVSAKEDKMSQMEQLIRKAYTEGTAVYLFNTFQLNDFNFQKEMETIQRRMFSNIYTQRLTATLSDSIAESVLKKPASGLSKLFGPSPEFQFFDTSGKFIGDNLSVVTAILSQCKSYVSGKELEDRLSGPPTGFSFGTIITTVAALFRGNKVVVKYESEEFHSASEEKAILVFRQAKNFGKASFKVVLKSLSYKERQEIVDILKQDCHYRKNTGDPEPSYNLNDFEVVDCIRTLSHKMIDKVKKDILSDDEKANLFKGSVQARNVFSQYTAAVTDANYIATANLFLQNADEYIDAVERVEKDMRFLETEFKNIEDERKFIEAVAEEFQKTGLGVDSIQEKMDLFQEARNKDLVANAAQLKQWAQDIKDIYYGQMVTTAQRLTDACNILNAKIQGLKQQMDSYPEEWNTAVYDKIDKEEKKLMPFASLHIELKGWNVKCSKSGMLLRDMTYQLSQIGFDDQAVDIWETEIVTSAPQPQTVPETETDNPAPQPASQPKELKMRGKMPNGTCTVSQYRQWLKQQLTMLNQLSDNDILNFNE